jgi:hypothetical protein
LGLGLGLGLGLEPGSGAHALVQIRDAAAGRQRMGGARAWGAPRQSRRAQHAQRALPEAGSVPCAVAHSKASSISPPAIGTKHDASAGRCGAVVLGDRVWRRSSAKGAQELHRLRMCLGLRHHPWHCGTGLLQPTGDRRDAHRP